MAIKKPIALYSGNTKELTAGDTFAVPSATLTGTAISFSQGAMYGTISAPVAGNITGVTTAAVPNLVVLIIHSSSTAPTFDSKFIKLANSGDYKTGVINLIYCHYIDVSHIYYSITQAA